jgi:hypothetical protein
MKHLVLAALLIACKSERPVSSSPATTTPGDAAIPWTEDFGNAVLNVRADVSKVMLAVRELRKQVEGERQFPEWPLPPLDFTRQGNAILANERSTAREIITDAANFRIVHHDDDPYYLAMRADGMMSSDEEKAKYRAARYRPAIEQLTRAKVVVVVAGTLKSPVIGLAGRLEEPARFDGMALVYEIATAKLLTGIPLAITGTTNVRLDKNATYYRQGDPAILELEHLAREALWTELGKRSPSVKPASIHDFAIDDE